MQVDPVSAGVQYDKEFIVCSLDLLSGLVEGLGSGIESLVFLILQSLFLCDMVLSFAERCSLI